MIRIEITRRIDAKQGRGRNKISPTSATYEPTEAAAIDFLRGTRDAGEEIAPGYMPMIEAKLYDADAYQAWVRNGGADPQPTRTLTADEIAGL